MILLPSELPDPCLRIGLRGKSGKKSRGANLLWKEKELVRIKPAVRAQLAARRRRFNLMLLVTQKHRNNLGEAQMKTGREKSFTEIRTPQVEFYKYAEIYVRA